MVSVQDRKKIVALVEEVTKDHKLPLLKALECVGISTTRYYSWRKDPEADDKRTHPNRKGIVTTRQPKIALTDEEYQRVVSVLTDPQYSDLSISQLAIAALDRYGEFIASRSTFYRIAKKEHLVGHRKPSKPSELPAGTYRRLPCKATAPNQVWCWDISIMQYFDRAKGMKRNAYIFCIIDLFSRMIINISAEADQTGLTARKFFVQAFEMQDITVESELTIHSDNGSAMRSSELLSLLLPDDRDCRHIVSYSNPRCSNDNAFIESFFGTLKGPMAFSTTGCRTLQECDQRAKEFAQRYNEKQYHKGINFVTPASRHKGQDAAVMEKRNQAQLRHFQAHPERYIKGRMHKHEVAGPQYLNWGDLPARVFNAKTKRSGTEQHGTVTKSPPRAKSKDKKA